jgi:hypothetical protein
MVVSGPGHYINVGLVQCQFVGSYSYIVYLVANAKQSVGYVSALTQVVDTPTKFSITV